LLATGLNLLIFAAVFAIAWLAGRPSLAELYGAQKFQVLTVVFGFAWSLILRASLFLVGAVAAVVFFTLNSKGGAESLQQFRPKIENLFDPKALANPYYVLLCTTWVSFVVAGLREELWRAGVIASLRALFPAEWPGRRWEWLAVFIAAVIFGLGHLTQGWGAVALTGTLGLGLGGIMVLRRSLPEAIVAHGCFDALTFALLALLSNKDLIRRLISDPEALRQIDQLLGR
jgi:membrane protease YdiL (CAAX protease family)